MLAREVVNLLARLDDARFEPQPIHHEIEAWDMAGTRVERHVRPPADVLAWIDLEFGGSWSSEVALGGAWVARDAAGIAGFAAFDARGLRFTWLRAWSERRDVGIFGPFGVAERARGTGLGVLLLRAALCSLRERGYGSALIPAVGGDRLRAYYEREAGAQAVERFDLGQLAGVRRAVVLASGSGSNFQSVADGARDRTLPLEVVRLVCNRPRAGAVERAARAGVPVRVAAWDRSNVPRALYDAEVIDAVAAAEPDLVLLLGWMHVLPAAFVERFADALNLHPSFLPLDPGADTVTMPDGSVEPALRGAHAVDDAFAGGARWGGASVHRLAVEVDRGAIVARAPLLRGDGEDKDAFVQRLHALEHRVLASAVKRWAYETPRGG